MDGFEEEKADWGHGAGKESEAHCENNKRQVMQNKAQIEQKCNSKVERQVVKSPTCLLGFWRVKGKGIRMSQYKSGHLGRFILCYQDLQSLYPLSLMSHSELAHHEPHFQPSLFGKGQDPQTNKLCQAVTPRKIR